jgi:predicted Holliday junction resolvase-like endonuclease
MKGVKYHGKTKSTKGKEMIKKRGRPPKEKKVIDSFVDVVEPHVSEKVSPQVAEFLEEKRCDCGKPVYEGSHQCWSCSHRS